MPYSIDVYFHHNQPRLQLYVSNFLVFLQHYRQGHGAHGAPPPYPGRGGPGHGYGEGRGHYNRASSHPAEFNQQQMRQDRRGGGGDRRSAAGNRGSRFEMQPMR